MKHKKKKKGKKKIVLPGFANEFSRVSRNVNFK